MIEIGEEKSLKSSVSQQKTYDNVSKISQSPTANQRDQLVRTRGMLDQTDSSLDKSRRTLLNMARKAVTNKIALISIIVVEVIILAGVIYWKFK